MKYHATAIHTITVTLVLVTISLRSPQFTQSPFIDGVPNNSHLDWPDAIFAPIEADTFYKAIYLVLKTRTNSQHAD